MMVYKSTALGFILILFLLALASCDGGGEDETDSSGPVLDNPVNDPGPGGAPPQEPGDDAAPNELQALILSLINEARTEGRNCGTEPFPPTNEVVWDVRIEDAAIMHSEDMAAMGMLTHVGSDGSDAGDRLMMQGYDAFSWGENLVVGVDDAEAAIESLFDSPSHCGIIMNSLVNEIGMASAPGLFQGFTTTYWTLVLASERP